MWHEARKQERKIRGMLVDYRRRAERRQDFYEKIKADPTQFMQIHGRKCKIHLDPAVAAAGESPAVMMPWQGQLDNLIDRFDGRAYLDIDRIPVVPKAKEPEEISADERHCNYERYRILSQNDFLGISEEKYLHQLHLEEQFGINAQLEVEKPKKKTGVGAAIPFTYEDSVEPNNVPFTQTIAQVTTAPSTAGENDESDSDLDVDVAIDISKIDTNQAHELNACGRHYGMKSNDFYSFLTKDSDEADALKLAREEEQEKIMLSGRKSRRERRAQRERRFAGRPISPPSYAAKEDEPTFKEEDDKNDSAESRSSTPENSGKITYITSFGGEDELQPHSKISINFKSQKNQSSGSRGDNISSQGVTYADKVKQNLEKLQKLNSTRSRSSESPKKPLAYQRRDSYSRSRSRSRTRRRPSYRNSNRNSRRNSYSRSRSRSRRRTVSHRRNSRSNYRRSSYSRRPSHNRRSYSSSSSTPPPVRRKSRKSSTSSSTSTTTSSSSSSSSDASKSRSKSPPARSRSKSKSVSRSKSKSVCRSESKSVVPVIDVKPAEIQPPPTFPQIPVVVNVESVEPLPVEPQVPIKKYYGRRREDLSSDDEMNVDDDTKSMDASQQSSNVATVLQASSSTKLGKQLTTNDNKATSSSKSFNPRDRLKRKMQILLNKQYKADKLAEIEKTERQVQQQQEREDEMRELALRLRRRQRELRHRYGTPTSSRSGTSDHNTDDEQNNVKAKVSSPRNGGASIVKKSSMPRSRSRSRRRSYSRSSSRDRYRKKYRSRSRDRFYRDSYSGRQRSRDRQKSRDTQRSGRDRQRSLSKSRNSREDRRRDDRDDRNDRERSRMSRRLVDY